MHYMQYRQNIIFRAKNPNNDRKYVEYALYAVNANYGNECDRYAEYD
jgi:hypothetical protein